ncbi:unnamed protein product [Rotaria magnacalcarata]|uniref:Chitin-binding type-2 domain-containing protein n=1 Tax=Rotaria magnacalcarata TaxID=392030 RepID=A0A816TDN8_9BILA|nr:unnamed protein product [Rotaria magnacalcarata]CAF4129059.1 unnamed protein product [Rotaria magnacalcarata]
MLISTIIPIDGAFKCMNNDMFKNPDNHYTFWHCFHGSHYLKPCPTNFIWSQVECQCVRNAVLPTVTITTTVSTSSPPPTTETALPTTEAISHCLQSNLITFENASTYSKISNGYHGLKWTNAYVLDTEIYPQWSESGFYSAVKSSTWVAFNMNGDRITITVDTPNKFSIKSFVVSSAWNDSVTLSMVSQRASTYYKEASFKIEKNRSTTIELNWLDINTVTFYASIKNSQHGEVFVMNDLCLDSNTLSTSTSTSVEIIDKCSLNEVLYQTHCYYLDGVGGECRYGYSLGSETILSLIADSLIGLNYKTAISGNCCVITSEKY